MIDIGSCLKFAIERLKKNPVFYVLGFFIIFAAQEGLGAVARSCMFGLLSLIELLPEDLEAADQIRGLVAFFGAMVCSIVVGLLLAPLWVGYVKGIRREIDGGLGEISDLVSEFRNFLPIVLNYSVAFGVLLGGFLCCILPGLLLWPLPFISFYFLAGGQTSGIEAYKSAWRLLWKNPIIVLLSFLTALLGLTGLFACCIGVLVTAPIAWTAQCMLIQQAIDRDRKPLEPPALPS